MINILAEHHGQGLADLMMSELVADRPSYLWVFEANQRARSFYGRYGFLPDGGRQSHEPTGQVEVRLVRK